MMRQHDQQHRGGFRMWLAHKLKLIALFALLAQSIFIPYWWVDRKFGSWMGKGTDFLMSAMQTVSVAFLAAMLLVIGRRIDGRWGIIVWMCLAVFTVHVIQDLVLAWGAYGQADAAPVSE